MRIIVFFDLPVKTKVQRKEATNFRKFLLNDGYYMVQYSVYARVCNGTEAVNKHTKRLEHVIPSDGSIRMLVVTEKQYQDIAILLGKPSKMEKPFKFEQLSIF
ncbi:MAG: CRISPR-associated endonuclease Cas2 [Filifactoraceae bacterium]